MLGGAWQHALAPEVFLRPVLVELGATCPVAGLFLLDSDYLDPPAWRNGSTRPEPSLPRPDRSGASARPAVHPNRRQIVGYAVPSSSAARSPSVVLTVARKFAGRGSKNVIDLSGGEYTWRT